MRELALFAGGGGGILGGILLGWRTVCAVEIDSYARRVLLARQRDGIFAPFPIWDDVCTFDGHPWRGHVDVISGGFPCQDISSAGARAGITGEKSGLWTEFARIIGEVAPRYVFVENSSDLVSRGLRVVLGDLALLGFDAEWGILGAHHVGAPHHRARTWIVARHPDRDDEPALPLDDEAPELSGVDRNAHSQLEDTIGCLQRGPHAHAGGGSRLGPNTACSRLEGEDRPESRKPGDPRCDWWDAEPGMDRVVDGMARRNDRLRVLGNGQVPAVAALAWRVLNARLEASIP